MDRPQTMEMLEDEEVILTLALKNFYGILLLVLVVDSIEQESLNL
jgi:hypothetical protein